MGVRSKVREYEKSSAVLMVRNLDIARVLQREGMYPVARESTDIFFRNKIVVGRSNCEETNGIDWAVETLSKSTRTWEEYQYDCETNHGRAHPCDMLYGWVLLTTCPIVRKDADVQRAFDTLCKVQLASTPGKPIVIPSLSKLKRIKAADALATGMWILIVRMPRPYCAKITVPFTRRKDIAQFPRESAEEYAARRLEMRRRADNDVHPTEDQLYLSKNRILLQAVNRSVVCNKCGAKGHHHEKTHDEVYAPLKECHSDIVERREFPSFMDVKPYPSEEIMLTRMLKEESGFSLNIRETTTRIPLRLARKLLIEGLEVEGTVHASGVGTRKRTLNENDAARPIAQHFSDVKVNVEDLGIQDNETHYQYFWQTQIGQAIRYGFSTLAKEWQSKLDSHTKEWYARCIKPDKRVRL